MDTSLDPRAFIDINGCYQSHREGVEKEAHDAWVKSNTWGLTRDDFIRLSYFHGNLEDGDDGCASEKNPINGSSFRPDDVVYQCGGASLTRRMVSEWLTDYSAFTRGFKAARTRSTP